MGNLTENSTRVPIPIVDVIRTSEFIARSEWTTLNSPIPEPPPFSTAACEYSSPTCVSSSAVIPDPVSSTAKSSTAVPPRSSPLSASVRHDTESVTDPRVVNLAAFTRRFITTRSNRFPSHITGGINGGRFTFSVTSSFCDVEYWRTETSARRRRDKYVGDSSSFKPPFLIVSTSSTLARIMSSICADAEIMSTSSSVSSTASVGTSFVLGPHASSFLWYSAMLVWTSSAADVTPCSGVRMSWLVHRRNSCSACRSTSSNTLADVSLWFRTVSSNSRCSAEMSWHVRHTSPDCSTWLTNRRYRNGSVPVSTDECDPDTSNSSTLESPNTATSTSHGVRSRSDDAMAGRIILTMSPPKSSSPNSRPRPSDASIFAFSSKSGPAPALGLPPPFSNALLPAANRSIAPLINRHVLCDSSWCRVNSFRDSRTPGGSDKRHTPIDSDLASEYIRRESSSIELPNNWSSPNTPTIRTLHSSVCIKYIVASIGTYSSPPPSWFTRHRSTYWTANSRSRRATEWASRPSAKPATLCCTRVESSG